MISPIMYLRGYFDFFLLLNHFHCSRCQDWYSRSHFGDNYRLSCILSLDFLIQSSSYHYCHDYPMISIDLSQKEIIPMVTKQHLHRNYQISHPRFSFHLLLQVTHFLLTYFFSFLSLNFHVSYFLSPNKLDRIRRDLSYPLLPAMRFLRLDSYYPVPLHLVIFDVLRLISFLINFIPLDSISKPNHLRMARYQGASNHRHCTSVHHSSNPHQYCG